MKKAFSVLFALLLFASGVLFTSAAAPAQSLPSAEIKAYNLIVEDNVYISYAVLFENAEGCETGLLIWTAPPSSYVYGSADYTLSPTGTAGGYTVFEFRDITAKQMTDVFYAAAYVQKDGNYCYSAPKKYSILQYAYNKLGYTGMRTGSEKLADYLESMLKYGGRTQTYENYHTERLASDKFYRVKAENAVLPDGFSSGLYKEGAVVPLTYTGEQTTGRVSWENAEGSPFETKSISGDTGITVTVGAKNAEYSAKPSYKAVFIGDSRMARYNTADLIAQFARADGINIYGIPVTNYLLTRDAYNLYSLCNSGRTAITNSTFLKAIADETPVDYVFCFAGRDFTLCYGSSRTNEKKALALIKTALLESNPNGKIALISSNGFPDGSPWFDSDFGDNETPDASKRYVSTSAAPNRLRSEHTAAIKTNAAALNSYVGNFCSMSYVGDGVEYYYNNYYDEYGIDLYDENQRDPSPAGSYLTAAITYAQTFGKTPYGSDVYGKLSETDAVLLQKVAHEFVFGEDVPEITTKKSAVLFIEPDRTPSTIKTGETYHENYKYLYETALSYRAHGKFIEYDQFTMNPYNRGTQSLRRDTTLSPENATPQRTVHLDCSGLVCSVYDHAFGYQFNRPNGAVSNQSVDMINVTSCQVYDTSEYYDYKNDAPTAELLNELKEKFVDTLAPGDVVVFRANTDWGHVMLYLGNGKFIHSSSGNRFSGSGSDYNFTGRYDLNDIPGDVYYEDITNLINSTQSRYIFGGGYRIKIFRPFDLGLTPTSDAQIRVNRLSGISAYKLTSAPEGVTVNPGDDVEFTVVVKNYGSGSKTLTLSETLPSGFTYSSGTGNTSFTIAPGEIKTLTYKVRVPSSKAAGAYSVATALEGLPLTDTPIYVAKTLTASQQASLVSAAEAALLSASSDLSFVKAAYSAGLSKTLSFESKADIYSSLCDTINCTHIRRSASDSYVTQNGEYVIDENKGAQFKTTSWTSTLRAPNVFGGKALKTLSPMPGDRRIRALNGFNFIAGDILVDVEDIESSDIRLYLCLGENRFATVKDGAPYTINDSSAARQFLDRVWGCDAFFVVRPSKGF